jgi:hypothetical protein
MADKDIILTQEQASGGFLEAVLTPPTSTASLVGFKADGSPIAVDFTRVPFGLYGNPAPSEGTWAQGSGAINANDKGSFAQGYGVVETTAGYKGCFAQGYDANSGSKIYCHGSGAFAQGRTYMGRTIKAGSTTNGAMAAMAQGCAYGGNIYAGQASFAQGWAAANNIVAVGGGFAQGHAGGGAIDASAGFAQGKTAGSAIIKSVGGSFAQGFANYGNIYALGKGCFAQGYTFNSTTITAGGTMYHGCFAQGYAEGGAIEAFFSGCFSQGYTKSGASGHIQSGGNFLGGAFAQGAVLGSGNIYAIGKGSFAQGSTYNANIMASGAGSFAQGRTAYGYIKASEAGAFAQGYTQAYGNIMATAKGSFAHGFAFDVYHIVASGVGAFAHGYSKYADVGATGLNSVQFGEGTNTIAHSLQVGVGISLYGKSTGAPSYTRDGMLYTNGSTLYVRLGGYKKTITVS